MQERKNHDAESAFRALGLLRSLRAYEKRHLHFLRTPEDHDLVCEIAWHQANGKPLSHKQLFALRIGSVPTIQRRVRRLRHAGALQQARSRVDRRVLELTLSPMALRLFARYAELLEHGMTEHAELEPTSD